MNKRIENNLKIREMVRKLLDKEEDKTLTEKERAEHLNIGVLTYRKAKVYISRMKKLGYGNERILQESISWLP